MSDKGFDFHFSFLPLAVRTLVNVLSLNNFCKSIVMIAKVQSLRIFVYSLFFKKLEIILVVVLCRTSRKC